MLSRILAVVLVAATAVVWPKPPAPAVAIPVVDSMYGHRLTDPFRYFENLKDARVQKYFRQQADYTSAVLGKLGPGRDRINADLKRVSHGRTLVYTFSRVGDKVFYLERAPGVNDAHLMVREGNAVPRLLLDPDALAKSTTSKAHLSISSVLPSPDGAYVAVSIVPGGAERQTHTRIVEVANGALLSEDFPRTDAGATAWGPDNRTVFYIQDIELKPGEPASDVEQRSKVYRHTIGTNGPDVAVFGIDLSTSVHMDPIDVPYLYISPASKYAIGYSIRGVSNDVPYYVAPVDALMSGTNIPWRKIADAGDDLGVFDLRGSTLYVATHKGAPHYKINAIDLSREDQTAANATPIVPESKTVIEQMAVARDALYIRGILGGLANLRKLTFGKSDGAGALSEIKLPYRGSISEFSTWPQEPGAIVGLESWARPLRVFSVDSNGSLTDTNISKPPSFDLSQYTSLEVQAKAQDGTLIPLSIIMRRGTKLDGTNPTYLQAYGAYGLDIDPYFLGPALAWIDMGGIQAVAHVRGGGEYGEAWHLAGKGPSKHNTFDDAIAAARYLIEKRYTSSSHLAIEGTSAGGIMVGGAITRHPELFAAALDVVGITDSLRSEASDPNGPSNTPEYGSVKTEAGYNDLYVMDAYQHIKNGIAYPAVMAVTGINDPRVAPWHPAKFVARLQQASSSGLPVLLRVDYDAGHGFLGASEEQRRSLRTDEYSFLLWQCGSPLFAGIPKRIPTK